MITVEEIIAERSLSKSIRHQLSRELNKLPKGNLYYKKEHGHYRPYVNRYGKETYLGKDKIDLVNRLIRKKKIRKSIELLDRNIIALSDMESKFMDLDRIIPDDIAILQPGKTRRELTDEFDKWVKDSEELNKRNRESRHHHTPMLITSDGVIVKSRAELIIYEFLKGHSIDFVYEKPITIDGITFHPDFTVRRRSDGMIILWEHFGLMDKDIYRTESRKKTYEYSKNGFWPFENLICTYDFGDGKIDISHLEKIIVMMGLSEPAGKQQGK